MQKPLLDIALASTLTAALGLIIRDYRHHFRYPLRMQEVIQNGSAQSPCEMTNISEAALAVGRFVIRHASPSPIQSPRRAHCVRHSRENLLV